MRSESNFFIKINEKTKKVPDLWERDRIRTRIKKKKIS